MSIQRFQRRGFVSFWVILTLFTLVALLGLACDAGWCVLVLNQLQAAADASALAGAQLVKSDQTLARQAAHDIAIANKAANITVKLNVNDANDAGGDIVLGRYNSTTQTFTVTNSNPNAVKVIANRTASGIDGVVPLVFGPVFHVNTIPLSRYAIATTAGGTGAGMLVLDPTANCALTITGNGTLQVDDGVIQVNSNSSCAVCNNGNPVVQASTMNVVGSSCLSSGILTGDSHNGQPVVPDPLAGMPAPPFLPPVPARSVGTTNDAAIQPGYYAGGIRRQGGTLTMAPGIYIVNGSAANGGTGGFDIGGNSIINGNGVMVYVLGGAVRLNGTGNIHMTPPGSGEPPVTFTGWEPYEHVTFFQARTNTTEAYFNGTNNLQITGTLYFPQALVHINGTGLGFGNQLIAGRVEIGGNGNVQIAYDGAFPAAAGGKVYLVE